MNSNQLKTLVKAEPVWFVFDPQDNITEKEWVEICQWTKHNANWGQIPHWLENDLSWEQMREWVKDDLSWNQTYLLVSNIHSVPERVRHHFRLPQPGEKFIISF
jgi:hypothetical protein